MREIMFRLRHRLNMIIGYEKWYVGHWQPDNPDEGFSLFSGYWEATPCWLYSVDGKRWTPTYIPHRYKDQFTGLLDKNEKEIYEGDIVDKQYHNLSVDDGIGEVELGGGSDSDGWAHGAWLGWKAGESSLLDVHSECEVIGNIYENPDLIKERSDSESRRD